MDIAEFLTARYDEQQAIAQAAFDAAVERGVLPRTSSTWYAPGDDTGMPSSFELAFGPEVIMLDLAVKRRIVAEYKARNDDVDLMLGPSTRRQREWAGLALAVRLLAAGEDDHSDFDPAWRVE